MRTPRIALLAGALVSLLLTGTAHAGTARADSGAAGAPVPTGAKALTHNPLYRTGKLTVPCGRHPDDFASVGAAKKHLTAMMDCMNASWSAQLKKAGLPFEKPKVRFITGPTRVCGEPWGEYVVGLYCTKQRQMVVMIDDYSIQQPADPDILHTLAHEYAHHVQNVTGILPAFWRTRVRTEAQALTYVRRMELQAECLAGAFMASIWASQEYTAEEREALVNAARHNGDEQFEKGKRIHGTGKNQSAWLQRGFDSASPAACNTWTAPASRVA
ncbi:neutral zinc metallopeptidase [Planomonospora sp. ID91781]|uniref:Metalloprotease-like protein n=1 Tax=Planomonospora sphaerica TaxID=161355 RepID=A0A171DMR7_9ACTN|nr:MULTISPECIES: neutral zinc metallopeptidase [Planomonospora]MBG0819291.1 neutral zinc metallopeptidase [Planomonospora sp. ID91781]GAT70311.1 metalloprotease-like protein [Planomonospora sphaerica]